MEPTNQMTVMRSTLTKMRDEFQSVLPPQIPVERFIRTTLTAVQMQPDLLAADRRSLMASCMKAAQDGLLTDGREAALIIFRGRDGAKVQYMPMIGGLLKKMRQSGEIASISAHVVYQGDAFDFDLGDEEKITHKRLLSGDRGKPVGAYAIAKTKDGAIYREVMGIEEIEKVRAVSKAKASGPWIDWWDPMAEKTVLKKLMKRLPSSTDLEQLIEADNEISDITVRPLSAVSQMNAALAATNEPESLPEPAGEMETALESSAEPQTIEAEVVPEQTNEEAKVDPAPSRVPSAVDRLNAAARRPATDGGLL